MMLFEMAGHDPASGNAACRHVAHDFQLCMAGLQAHGVGLEHVPVASGLMRQLDAIVAGQQCAITLRKATPLRNELQDLVQMRFNDAGRVVYFLPQEIIDNTIRANNVSATSATGYSNQGVPTGRYIGPASNASCIESYGGKCGTNQLVLYGPSFARFDLSVIKRFKITERVNFEFRAEFLNAFNNINFLVGGAANDVNNIGGFGSATFGQVTQAYQDTSTTNDPGGRMVQFVARINF